MEAVPMLAWIFQIIPEAIAMIYLSTKLLGSNFTSKGKTLIVLGIVQAVFVYVVRLLPLSFGIHSIILTITISIWIHLFTKKSSSKCLLSASFSLLFLSLFELLSFQVFINLVGRPEVIISNIWLRIAVGWPHIIFMILIGILAGKIQQWRVKKIPVN